LHPFHSIGICTHSIPLAFAPIPFHWHLHPFHSIGILHLDDLHASCEKLKLQHSVSSENSCRKQCSHARRRAAAAATFHSSPYRYTRRRQRFSRGLRLRLKCFRRCGAACARIGRCGARDCSGSGGECAKTRRFVVAAGGRTSCCSGSRSCSCCCSVSSECQRGARLRTKQSGARGKLLREHGLRNVT
jgi:hypothetical protein